MKFSVRLRFASRSVASITSTSIATPHATVSHASLRKMPAGDIAELLAVGQRAR